jgi:T4-like virus tail tube protein gp19.
MESSDKEIIMKQLPGMVGVGKIVLKRGKNSSMELWAWHEAVLNGDIVAARKSASLVMYNYDGKAGRPVPPGARLALEDRDRGVEGGLQRGPMETVTIVCERIQRVGT